MVTDFGLNFHLWFRKWASNFFYACSGINEFQNLVVGVLRSSQYPEAVVELCEIKKVGDFFGASSKFQLHWFLKRKSGDKYLVSHYDWSQFFFCFWFYHSRLFTMKVFVIGFDWFFCEEMKVYYQLWREVGRLNHQCWRGWKSILMSVKKRNKF